MHAIKGSWAGRAYALATTNDSGGKKSRNRRSKEERKAMVESFIKKYQKLNNGDFPSLNLTNKEVGGSFYTVREIVREIIQENRVLAPPKVSDEHGNSEFLEQPPLESISMEPQIDLHVSDRAHMVTHIVPPKDHISSEEKISSSNEQFNGSFPLKLENEQTKEVSEVADKDEASDKTSETHEAPNHSLINNDEKIVSGFEVIEEYVRSDKPVIKNVESQDNSDNSLLSSQEINGLGSQRLTNEHYNKNYETVHEKKEFGERIYTKSAVTEILDKEKHEVPQTVGSRGLTNEHYNENDETVDEKKEFGERIYTKSAVTEILDKEKHEAQDVEVPQTVKSHVNSNVVVETFPLRPVPKTVYNKDGESGGVHKAGETLETIQSSSGFVNAKDEKRLTDEKVELNLEGSKYSSASKPVVLDVDDTADVESENTMADEITKVTIVDTKASHQESSSFPKGNNPTLDRINLETWEGTSKKSTEPESNPLLSFVKAFIASFVKFWTE